MSFLSWSTGWFRNLPIFWKILFCFGIMIVCLVAITFYVEHEIIDANNNEMEYGLNARSLRNDANRMRLSMLTLQLLNSDNADITQPQLDELKEATTASETIRAKLHKHFDSDPDAAKILKDLDDATNEYVDVRDKDELPMLLQHDTDRVRQLSMGAQNDRFENMRKLAAKLATHAKDVADARAKAGTITFRWFVLAIAILAIFMSLVLGRQIATPLARLRRASEELAIGNLDVNLQPHESRDELGGLTRSFISMLESWQNMATVAKRVNDGDLTVTMPRRSENDLFADAFNSLIESVGTITSRFREAIGVVTASAEEILVSVKESAAGATQTATAATQTTAIVEEVRQTSHVASQKAKQVSESAQKTAQITAVGRKATEDIIEGMNRIREQVDLIAEAMVRLSEKSQSISSIIATVDDLAKQSNLLAVNASIEAARAGELGKGFGVVAQEVKSMAEQSKQSTAQVRIIIAEIQQATNAAAMATELGGKAVDASMQQSGQAGESIAVLANSVVESAQAAAQIAVSNQQQLAGVDQVATAMASIRDACGEHLVAIRHVESAANRLNEVSSRLKSLVEKFEVYETSADSGLMADKNR